MSSNLLPKLTSFRDRAIRIREPFEAARRTMNEDMKDLRAEFDSAFKEELDRETASIQWAGLIANARQHFIDAEKLDKARLKRTCAEQYDLFREQDAE
jgi:hypothetical protein